MAEDKDRSGFLSWLQATIPADVLKDGTFAEQMTRLLFTTDGSTVPSTHTLEALRWACKEGANSQLNCLWGVYLFLLPSTAAAASEFIVMFSCPEIRVEFLCGVVWCGHGLVKPTTLVGVAIVVITMPFINMSMLLTTTVAEPTDIRLWWPNQPRS